MTHLEEKRLANEEEEDLVKLLEDENFNGHLQEMVKPMIEEAPANRSNQEGSETQSSSGGGAPAKWNKCKVCSALFQREDQLIEHLKTHIERIKVKKQETDKPFECNICKYRFEFMDHMIRHKANNHDEKLAAEEAESDELSLHRRQSGWLRGVPVPRMSDEFVKQRSLTWHLKTHGGRKPKQERDDGYPSTE